MLEAWIVSVLPSLPRGRQPSTGMTGLYETKHDLRLLRHYEIREHFPLSVDRGSVRGGWPDASQLGPPYRPKGALDNYFDVVDETLIQELAQVVGGEDLVIKTHGPPRGEIASLIVSGALLPMPRSATRARSRSRCWTMDAVPGAGSSHHIRIIQSLEDTLPSIDNQSGTSTPGPKSLTSRSSFTMTSASTAAPSCRGWRPTSVWTSTPDQVLQTFIGNKVIGQFSKGKALRYSEMAPEDQTLSWSASPIFISATGSTRNGRSPLPRSRRTRSCVLAARSP